MSLFNSISISMRALLADQAALDATTNNIANANTPGYSRRRAVLEELPPSFGDPSTARGVAFTGIQRLRDKVLELRTISEVQIQARNQSIADSLQSVELLFSENSKSIGNAVSAMFEAVSELSTDASSPALRQSVLAAAGNFVASVQKTSNELALTQTNLDRGVAQCVQDVNHLTQQIAAINTQVASKEKLGEDPGALADQRGLLIRQLSELVDVNVVDDPSGLTLTTSNGTALVVGNESFNLDAALDSQGRTHVFSLGNDITGTLKGGKLGGLIEVRDSRIAGLIGDLDTLGFELGSAMNAANRSGYDLNGNPGSDLFTLPPTTAGAASSFSVSITDTNLIAASKDGTVGGNGNIQTLLSVRDQRLVGNMTATTFYADIVFRVGGQVANAESDAEAGNLIVNQLDDQRGAISGVNTDEEAANLIRFQRAYQAAARVIQVVNELSEIAVNLGRN